MSAQPPRNLTIRESRFMQLKLEDPDISDRQALLRAGFDPWTAGHADRVIPPELREYLEDLRQRAVAASLAAGFIDATEVLNELIRSLARFTQQAERLHGMLGHDIAELYSETGALRAVADWPEHWRRQLVVEVESREESERSHDGATKDKDGGWDKVGELKKVKRESTLGIERELRNTEKEIRETLEAIGRHVQVKAWQNPMDKLGDGLQAVAGAIDAAIAEGRQRAASRNKAILPSNAGPDSK